MTEQTTPAASDMSPDAPCRVLIAPCGCLVGGDITMSGPRRWRAAGTTRVTGFCRTRAEADEDAARGYREEVRTVRAMAERVGLVDLHPGESVMWRANQRRHILATPWREVPNA